MKVFSFLELQAAIRETFRATVVRGVHGLRPEPGLQLFSGLVSKEDAAQGMAGSGFGNLPSTIDKQLTLWLLRDFIEHLPDAGVGREAEYLRLKAERLLDAPAYSERPPSGDAERNLLARRETEGGEGPYSLVGGRTVEPGLLEDLVASPAGRAARGWRTTRRRCFKTSSKISSTV